MPNVLWPVGELHAVSASPGVDGHNRGSVEAIQHRVGAGSKGFYSGSLLKLQAELVPGYFQIIVVAINEDHDL